MSPVHEEVSDHSDKCYDRLQGDKVATENKNVDRIDILVSDFKLYAFLECVVFFLGLVQLACYIDNGLLGTDLKHRLIFMKKL